jgi:hypothetical protein
VLNPSSISFDQNRLGTRTFGTTMGTMFTLPALPKRQEFLDSWLVINQLLTSIAKGEHELQRYFGSFTSSIPVGFIQQVYAAAKTVTANGNAKIDTSQSKFGGASGSFDGTNSYLSASDSNDWYFGTGNFTIDFWVRFNSLPSSGTVAVFYDQATDINNVFKVELYNNSGTYQWYFVGVSGGTTFVSIGANAAAPSLGTWYHIAFVRSGNSWYIFQAGTQVGSTGSSSASISDNSGLVYIGLNAGTTMYLDGWLDEFRVSKGVARWTSNFTPPTAPYVSDSYTVLLLHMDGTNGSTTFVDSSGVTGPDFSINASPTSQSVGAGSQASSLLTFASQSSYTGTVSIAVTSGCSATGMSCSFLGSITSVNVPSGGSARATLLVQTSLTTPGGTYPIVVTGTDSVNSALSHKVTLTVTVNGPNQFNFNVKAGATQIVVTVTWTGSGTTTTVAIAPPSGPTIYDTSGVTYDRTSIAVVSGQQPSYTNIHRATFTITAPTSPQLWTLYVSGPSTYTVTVEVT